MKEKTRFRKVLGIAALCLVLLFALNGIAAGVVYETVFSRRYETEAWADHDPLSFEELTVKTHTFESRSGTRLAGYTYGTRGIARGLVVFCHGFGNGHRAYLPLISALCRDGWDVFCFDMTGGGESEGDGLGGFLQAIDDVDAALSFAKTLPGHEGEELCLFGHSLGAFAAGCVLDTHSEVTSAVLVSCFDKSEDMLYDRARDYIGEAARVLLPAVTSYEEMKFSRRLTSDSVTNSIAHSSARVLVLHAADDLEVPKEYGLDAIAASLAGEERVTCRVLEDGGHIALWYTAEARVHYKALETARAEKRLPREEYYEEHLDRDVAFDVDSDFVEMVSSFFKAA